MIVLILNDRPVSMEFSEFMHLVQEGRVPADARVRGDVLTGGETVAAGELRVYAILRGRPLPPPRQFPRDPEQPDLDATLRRIRWEPSHVVVWNGAHRARHGRPGADLEDLEEVGDAAEPERSRAR
jgi:hypothetical protein